MSPINVLGDDMDGRSIGMSSGVIVICASSALLVSCTRHSSSYAAGVVYRLGAMGTICLLIALLSLALNKLFDRHALKVTTATSFVAAVVAFYEMSLFSFVVPRIADVTIDTTVEVIGEVSVPALLAAICWAIFLRERRVLRAIWTFILAVALCVGGLFATSPLVARRVTEETFGARVSIRQHVTGAHTPAFPRHVSYVMLAAIAGIPFAVRSRRASQRAQTGRYQ